MDRALSRFPRLPRRPGKLRLRYREGWDAQVPLQPGERYDVTVRLWDVAHRIEAGNRLGLVIRGDWLPRWSRNLHTAEPIADAERGRAATTTIHHGAGGSSLRLRELPGGCYS